jgi:hypothetical protein
MIASLAGHLPAPPPPPTSWGDEAHVRALLGGQTLLAIQRRSVDFVAESPDGMIADYERQFGPIVSRSRCSPQPRTTR